MAGARGPRGRAGARLTPSAPRTALVALLPVAIALMGPARIHSGEHRASDVLGGYLIGILWLVVTIEMDQRGSPCGRGAAAGH